MAVRVDLSGGKIDYKSTNRISQNKYESVVACVPNGLTSKALVKGE